MHREGPAIVELCDSSRSSFPDRLPVVRSLVVCCAVQIRGSHAVSFYVTCFLPCVNSSHSR